jgi:hypothetical protein
MTKKTPKTNAFAFSRVSLGGSVRDWDARMTARITSYAPLSSLKAQMSQLSSTLLSVIKNI